MISTKRWTQLVLVGAVAVDLVAPTGMDLLRQSMESPPRFSAAQVASVMAALDDHTESLLSTPGVVGTALGLGDDGLPAVKVYVAQAGVLGVPASLNGVQTDVEVVGRFVSWADPPDGVALEPRDETGAVDRTGHFPRPVPIGVSSGQTDVTAGTIGARVLRGGDHFALSNNHVFANSNRAKPGDPVVQPGTVDGGRAPDDVIGVLADFEPIAFCKRAPAGCPANRIDAAIAEVDEGHVDRATPSDGYGLPRAGSRAANLMLAVQKYGRTTGHTTGSVSGIFATVNVDYRIGVARFVDQIIITGSSGAFSGPGDSGSLVVSKGKGGEDRVPVGLLFGGNRLTTIVSPIDLVLKRFDVEIDGER